MADYFPIPSLHPAGRPILAAIIGINLLLIATVPALGVLCIPLTLFSTYFFRDPDRHTPLREGLLVSPADGRIIAIEPVSPPAELELGDHQRLRISIFLSVFDVHVNRIAAGGKVRKKIYHPGKFLHAAADKASEDNERLALVVDMPGAGRNYAQVQIAGYVARRILCDVSEQHSVTTGQRYGIIRFGSRMDVYLPAGVLPLVAVGQTMIGGETVLADCDNSEPARLGMKQ